MITIRPIKSIQEFRQIEIQANSDAHIVAEGSNVVLKDGNCIGTVLYMPTVWVWMDTRVAQARDSFQMLKMVESHLAMSGAQMFNMPCRDTSPFFPFMSKLGFIDCSNHKNFLKGLK